MAKLVVVLACSALVVVGCSSVSVDCAPLISDGTRCVCPEGTVQVDDWVCELPDGGFLERPGRPDGGLTDGSLDATVADSGVDGGTDAGELVDAGTDAGELDGGTDSGVDAGVDAGFDAGPPPRPDLLISCTTPAAIVGSGDEVVLPYEVANLGSAPATNIDITVDGEWGGGLTAMLDSQRILALEPSGAREGTLRFVAPNTIGRGANAIRCRVDSTNSVEESDESNNDSSNAFAATGAPDVVVTGFLPSPIRSSTVVRFLVENQGRVGTRSSWIFEGQLVGPPVTRFTMDSGALYLPAGETRTVDAMASVPAAGSGQARFSASADSDANPANNSIVRDSVSFQP